MIVYVQIFYSGDWSYDKEDLERIQRELKEYDAQYYLSSHFDPETSEELWRDLNQLSAIERNCRK